MKSTGCADWFVEVITLLDESLVFVTGLLVPLVLVTPFELLVLLIVYF